MGRRVVAKVHPPDCAKAMIAGRETERLLRLSPLPGRAAGGNVSELYLGAWSGFPFGASR